MPRAPAAAESTDPLVLERTIPLPHVSGRIDHMAIDLVRRRLIVAALGNGTVELIDLAAGGPVRNIRGLHEPQGVGYADKQDLIVVASAGDGSVRMFRGSDLAPAGRIDLHDDADNVRVDPGKGVVVGYGNGALAVIDASNLKVAATVPLHGHPEGFQIEPATGRAFVNVPDAGQIAVVDLGTRQQVATWKVPGVRGNFPMALDAEHGQVAVVFRKTPSLVLLDSGTGAVTAKLPVCGDADDVFVDARRQRLYVSCGAGEIAVFQRDGAGYRPLTTIPTASGARTALFVAQLDRLFVAERAGLLGSNAAIRVYRPTP